MDLSELAKQTDEPTEQRNDEAKTDDHDTEDETFNEKMACIQIGVPILSCSDSKPIESNRNTCCIDLQR